MCSFRDRVGQKGARWVAGTSLHNIAKGTAPAVVVKMGPRAFGKYIPVELRSNVQLVGANAQ